MEVAQACRSRCFSGSASGAGTTSRCRTAGRRIWRWDANVPDSAINIGGPRVNRGVAILDGTVFVATLDARLVALDAESGAVRWSTVVADNSLGYWMSGATLAIDRSASESRAPKPEFYDGIQGSLMEKLTENF